MTSPPHRSSSPTPVSPAGQGFPNLTIVFNTSETHQRIAEAIQAQWKKNLGIDGLSRQPGSQGARKHDQGGADYQIARYAWFGDYDDANTFMTLMISNGGNNQTGWANPEYDRLVALAANTADPATREKVFQQAEGILVDEVPILPIYFYTRTTLRRPEVKGWYNNILDIHNLKGVYLQAEPPAKK